MKKVFCAWLLFSSVSYFAVAQQQESLANGIVLDEKGSPLPGVSVVEKGTRNGTTTDFDGKFTLTTAGRNAVLWFSFVGYKTIERAAKEQMQVKMEPEISGLEEVVVVGYGVSTKKALTNSVSSIKTDKMQEVPYTSPLQGLAGRVPGLFIRQSGGSYSSAPTISIRGAGEPLYVIDGIIASKTTFQNLLPSDIESVNVLKDFASTSVYGFGASNGIIQVVTKTGKGKLRVNYAGDESWQYITVVPTYMNWEQRLDYQREANIYAGLSTSTLQDPNYYGRGAANPLFDVVKRVSAQRRHTITLSGGGENSSAYLSLGGFFQDGIYRASKNNGLNRYTMDLKTEHRIEKIGLTLRGFANLQRSQTLTTPKGDEAFGHIRYAVTNPYYVANRDEAGNFTTPSNLYYNNENAIAETDDRAGFVDNKFTQIFTQLNATWKVPFVKGLSFFVLGSYRGNQVNTKTWTVNGGQAIYYDQNENPQNVATPRLSESAVNFENINFQGHIDYDRQFGSHEISAKAMYIYEESKGDGFNAYRQDFPSTAFPYLRFGARNDQLNNDSDSERPTQFARLGYLGQLKYNYANRYIIQGSARYDGYYGFAPGRKFALFPSVSVGWNLDNEPYMKTILEKAHISEFKIRASTGSTGAIGGAFGHLTSYAANSSAYYSGGAWRFGTYETNIPPPVGSVATWYTSTDQDLGVDLSFLNKKILFSWDWYLYSTSGFLRAPANIYATTLGLTLPSVNNVDSKVKRGGMDFSLGYVDKFGDFDFSAYGNFGFYNIYWTRHNESDANENSNPRTRRSNSLQDYTEIGYQSQGLYQNIDDILDSPRFTGATQTTPGEIKYQDVNGDGKIDTYDRVKIVPIPLRATYGLNLTGSWKGLTLDVLFQGEIGRQANLRGIILSEEAHRPTFSLQKDYAWSPDNPEGRLLRPVHVALSSLNGGNNYQVSSFWYINSAFLRLRSVTLSYDFKKVFKEQLKIFQSLQVVLSGVNLLTFSETLRYGFDPEGNPDLSIYPNTSTVSCGVRVTF